MKDGLQVLVVDDDRRMVKTLCDILCLKGHDSIPAYHGGEAVEKVKAAIPDCVLMDIRMPGTDGVDTLQAIRELAPGLPVVLMSAYVTDERARGARDLGVDALLTKPVDVQHILCFLDRLKE
jgi:CheY-like chemotaxis protein